MRKSNSRRASWLLFRMPKDQTSDNVSQNFYLKRTRIQVDRIFTEVDQVSGFSMANQYALVSVTAQPGSSGFSGSNPDGSFGFLDHFYLDKTFH